MTQILTHHFSFQYLDIVWSLMPQLLKGMTVESTVYGLLDFLVFNIEVDSCYIASFFS